MPAFAPVALLHSLTFDSRSVSVQGNRRIFFKDGCGSLFCCLSEPCHGPYGPQRSSRWSIKAALEASPAYNPRTGHERSRRRRLWTIKLKEFQPNGPVTYFASTSSSEGEKTVGVFSQIAFANKDTSPVTKFFNAGIGGNGLIKSRNRGEFGLAYAYTDLSSDLKDNINLVTLGEVRLRPEHQVEVFYNLFITPWLQLTGDLQIIRGVRPSAETAIVPGGRIVMIS